MFGDVEREIRIAFGAFGAFGTARMAAPAGPEGMPRHAAARVAYRRHARRRGEGDGRWLLTAGDG